MASFVKINIYMVVFMAMTISMCKCISLGEKSKLLLGYSKFTILNFTEATAKNQYRSEEHTVCTEDGYVLKIFRIVKAKNCYTEKKQIPVLMMHGLLENSDVFLDAGPSAGLAYLLSDACYDVWVGNQRGNNYGRKHLRLNPDKDSDFWQYSIDEVGFYDVPAMIDYILKTTEVKKINYIGFSQGASAHFILCTERPKYCKKTGVIIALAPPAILDHEESMLLKFIFRSALLLKDIFNMFGIHEVLGKGKFFQQLLEYLCQITGSIWTEVLCGTCGFLDSYQLGSMTSNTQQLIFSHFFVGTSLNTLARYGQVLASGKFQKFDYGKRVNLKRYNSTKPPEYNLQSMTTPVMIIQGRNDKLVSIKDTLILSTKLPNLLEMVEVSNPDWTHFDMLYNRDIKKMIFPKINEYLEQFSYDKKMNCKNSYYCP